MAKSKKSTKKSKKKKKLKERKTVRKKTKTKLEKSLDIKHIISMLAALVVLALIFVVVSIISDTTEPGKININDVTMEDLQKDVNSFSYEGMTLYKPEMPENDLVMGGMKQAGVNSMLIRMIKNDDGQEIGALMILSADDMDSTMKKIFPEQLYKSTTSGEINGVSVASFNDYGNEIYIFSIGDYLFFVGVSGSDYQKYILDIVDYFTLKYEEPNKTKI